MDRAIGGQMKRARKTRRRVILALATESAPKPKLRGAPSDQNRPQTAPPPPPGVAHVRPVLQVRSATVPVPQHGCPMAPHAPQVRLAVVPPQTKPVLQVSPPPPLAGQHA